MKERDTKMFVVLSPGCRSPSATIWGNGQARYEYCAQLDTRGQRTRAYSLVRT